VKPKLLLLGGSGFAGARIAACALQAGWHVVSLSRRGAPPELSGLEGVEWRVGDATAPNAARELLQEGGYNAVWHAVGLLFEGAANRLVSGSGSVPGVGASYDLVTRQSAHQAAAAAAELCERLPGGGPPAFGFVSAAEAGWSFRAPVDWLERYLIAKRAVEAQLLDVYGVEGARTQASLRPIILRPSLIWSQSRPGSLPAVAAFWATNAMGVPFVDKPVHVDTLARAAVSCLGDERARGVLTYREMEERAASYAPQQGHGQHS
jgi:nucleoside-diphosphate-sugar epimerase